LNKAVRPSRPQTRRQRVEEKEQAIIAAARAVFGKNGFDKAKIAEIAKRAGVAEGTVYLYFENKNALLLAVATEFYDRLTHDAAEGIKSLPDTKSRLAFLARHHVERVAAEWPMLSTAMMPFKASDEYRQTEGYQLNRTYVEVFDQVIRDGINRGDIRTDVPLSVMRDIFYGGLEYGARTLRMRPDRADLDETVDQMMQILSVGMLVKPAAVDTDGGAADAVLDRLEKIATRLETTAATTD
jgi:TetR/AcrR family transcriptional regulator, fatty acid metabolism regulator protein